MNRKTKVIISIMACLISVMSIVVLYKHLPTITQNNYNVSGLKYRIIPDGLLLCSLGYIFLIVSFFIKKESKITFATGIVVVLISVFITGFYGIAAAIPRAEQFIGYFDEISVTSRVSGRDVAHYIFTDEFGNEKTFEFYRKRDDILPDDLNTETLYCVHYEKNLDVILRIDAMETNQIG